MINVLQWRYVFVLNSWGAWWDEVRCDTVEAWGGIAEAEGAETGVYTDPVTRASCANLKIDLFLNNSLFKDIIIP